MSHYAELLHAFDAYAKTPHEHPLHANDIAYLLKHLFRDDKTRFFTTLDAIKTVTLGYVLLALPEDVKEKAIAHFSASTLSTALEYLESDDATDLVQDIHKLDTNKAQEVLQELALQDRVHIGQLSRYHNTQAGAYMQVELFDAHLHETIEASLSRLREKKRLGKLHNIYQVFILDDARHFIGAMGLEDLIINNMQTTYDTIIAAGTYTTRSVKATDPIEEVAKIFEDYDLSVIPVVDFKGHLLGRITSDDIYDVIEERATKQVYNLAGVNEDAESENQLIRVVKKRASWLGVNLITAIVASIVIGMFDATLQAYIPLAILMPIVASMGGNAGTQTLTVMVRQMALGEIDTHNARHALKREMLIALLNGLFFALIIGVITYLWFGIALLGVVIALSMVINLCTAGLFGGLIPLVLKHFHIDPAVGSTVLLTTATDVVGFFSFLALAQLILL